MNIIPVLILLTLTACAANPQLPAGDGGLETGPQPTSNPQLPAGDGGLETGPQPTSNPQLPITELPITNSPTPQLPTETPNSPSPSPFPLAIPIPPDGVRTVDPSYRFATTQGGAREPHHGVEFLNPFGSPALAAADGVVLFAGNDNNGGPYTPPGWYAFYGNFVIIQHTLPNSQFPIPQSTNFYTLYAHLSELSVQTGDTVQAGQEVGRIGFSGAAEGPHLHLEVRLDGTAYANSRNPELWLQPEEGHGALAGRILDANGYPIPPTALTITPLDPPGYPLYLNTYEEPAVAGLPPYYENFALGNLPAGKYQLTFVIYGLQEYTLDIQPGQLTQLEIIVGDEN